MSEYTDFLIELLAPLDGVSAKRMFGGHGLFFEGRMFGLISDDVLYLKADAINMPDFTAQNLGPFQYNKAGKLMNMSYYQAPEEFFDDPDVAVEWANKAVAAARRAKP